MASSVRECISTRQAGCPCHVFRFSALAQVSGHFSSALGNPWVLVAIALMVILFAAMVVFPAVWSRKSYRRKAALDVLERLLRWKS